MRASLQVVWIAGGLAWLSCGGGSDTTDASAPKTCLAGASEEDCQLCGPTLPSSCAQVCPATDCSRYPVPAECAAVCGGAICCTCNAVAPDISYWSPPQLPPTCGTPCSAMIARWDSYLADGAMVACSSDGDCTVVGGQPALDPCNGRSSIGYCGKAANATVYRASPAAGLEAEFAASCTDHVAFDCGPGYAACTNGRCTIAGFGCCMGCNRDGGVR